MTDLKAKPLQFVVQWAERGDMVHRLVEVTTKKQVLTACKSAFSLEGEYALEAYLPSFDLFVRIDDPDTLPDGGKLRLIKILGGALSAPSSVSTADTVPILTLDVSSLTERQVKPCQTPLLGSCDTSRSEENLPAPLLLDAADADGDGGRPEEELTADDGPVATDAYPALQESAATNRTSRPARIPIWERVRGRLSASCKITLNAGGSLSEHDWSELMQGLYDEATKTSFYPERNQYRSWATDMIDTFGKAVWKKETLLDSIEFIRSKIRGKFKNARHISSEEKLVEERATKRIRLGAAKEKQAAAGLPNYDPGLENPTPEGIQDMYKLKTNYDALPDEEKQGLKEATYALRRWYFLKTNEPLTRLRDRMPWLFTEDEMWSEFHRICGSYKRTDATSAIEKIFGRLREKFFTRSEKETMDALLDALRVPSCGTSLREGEPAMTERTVTCAGAQIRCDTISNSILLWAVSHTVMCLGEKGDRAALLAVLQRMCLGINETYSHVARKKAVAFESYIDA